MNSRLQRPTATTGLHGQSEGNEMTVEVGIITADLFNGLPRFEERWKLRQDARRMDAKAVVDWEQTSQEALENLRRSEIRRHDRFVQQCFGDVPIFQSPSLYPVTHWEDERQRRSYLLDHLRTGWLARQSTDGNLEEAQAYINGRRRKLGTPGRTPSTGTSSTPVRQDVERSGSKRKSNKRKLSERPPLPCKRRRIVLLMDGVRLTSVSIDGAIRSEPASPPAVAAVSTNSWETVVIGRKRKVIPSADHTSVANTKPGPPRAPLVWADSRQELCESLPYYRAFQSGLYMKHGVAYGYLLDGFDAPRDIWARDGKVIISHGGGKAKTIVIPGSGEEPGQKVTVLKDDQDVNGKDPRIATLVNAAKSQRPIVLIAGNRYKQLPWSLGTAAYAVLGWYFVTYSWVEADFLPSFVAEQGERPYRHRHKFRFDWCAKQGEPWFSEKYSDPGGWAPVRTADTSPLYRVVPPKPSSSSKDHESDGTPMVTERRIRTEPAQEIGLRSCVPETVVRLVPIPISQSPDRSFGQLKRPDMPFVRSQPRTLEAAGIDAMSSWKSKTCSTCSKPSAKIYKQGWFCLNESCKSFWRVRVDGNMHLVAPESALSYRAGFLEHCAPANAMMELPFLLVPPHPDSDYIGLRSAWKGLSCLRCGKLSSREHWREWSCSACHWCPVEPAVTFKSIESDAVLLDNSSALVGHLASGQNLPISIQLAPGLDVLCTKYTLPDNAGAVYHLSSVEGRVMADRMFRRLQVAANDLCRFQRHPLKATKMTGRLLAQQYSLNIGADYKYTAETVTIPFEHAPSVFRDALQYVTDMTAIAVPGNEHIAFNECLAVLYRDGQGMAYHDDGELGLGPLVAGLSLGSDAKMSFRRKRSCRRAERKAAGRTDTEQKGKSKPPSRSDLDVIVRHGDVLIMQGRKMQDLYEHRVVPTGLRAACTFRHITPAHTQRGKSGAQKGSGAEDFGTGQSASVFPPTEVEGGEAGVSTRYREISPEEVYVPW